MLNVILLVGIVVGSGSWSFGIAAQTQVSRTGGAEPPFEICPSNKPVERARPKCRSVAPRLGGADKSQRQSKPVRSVDPL